MACIGLYGYTVISVQCQLVYVSIGMFSPIGLYAIVARFKALHCLHYIDIQAHCKMALKGYTVPYRAIVVYSVTCGYSAACTGIQ